MIRKRKLQARVEELERKLRTYPEFGYGTVQTRTYKAWKNKDGGWSAFRDSRSTVIVDAETIPKLNKKLAPNLVVIEVCEYH